jgi:hypothetical protein
MTTPISSYSFLPWARQGLGVYIRETDQDTTVLQRGTIDVTLQVTAQQIGGGTVTPPVPSRPVQLYGPGDVIGVDRKAIVRTEPRDWITNFETNYLPFIEFYDEDFPWRYTPAAASSDGKRLRPWLALVVLAEGEFEEPRNVLGRPLPFITVADAANKFPPFDQLWAWAHVHVDATLGVDPADTTAIAAKLGQIVDQDRDRAYSRLLCPRILQANTAYHAFLMPAFETGRLAGLNHDPGTAPFATQGAWDGYAGKVEDTLFPFYHRWYFRTGTVGDFEYLVRLLEPRTVDPRVGRRDMDVRRPGLNLPGIMGLGGILRLGGALRAPLLTLSPPDRAEYDAFERWGAPYPHPFQTALAGLVNLADDYTTTAPATANDNSGVPGLQDEDDPVIVPPLYGRWHSRTSRLVPADGDPDRERWVHELNLDPRHRAASGFGTEVVTENQESYMEAAWQQVGRVLEANRRIRLGQMALSASRIFHARTLARVQAISPEKFLALSSPVYRRVLSDGRTIHQAVRESTVPAAAVSKVMRQSLRPRSRVDRLLEFDPRHRRDNLIERMSSGDVSAAPPKVIAPSLPSEETIADKLSPTTGGGLVAWLAAHRMLALILFVIALLLALVVLVLSPAVGLILAIAVVVAAFLLSRAISRFNTRSDGAASLVSDQRTPESVDEMPKSPDFRIGIPGQGPAPNPGTTDSVEGTRFKEALRNVYTVDVVERALPVTTRVALPVRAVADVVLTQLQPSRTIPARVLSTLAIPDRIRTQQKDPFGEVMVYPIIDLPMYEPLKGISSELFLPNIQLIQANSITLLESNQKFIESYMVGLNHEMARELLWREYPTDQRGSYFRQFWDVRGFLTSPTIDANARRERLYDIPKLHEWDVDTGLGAHDNREAQGDKEEELVLVIRGELLKKYPTAVIYANRAAWERDAQGAIDKTKPRQLAPIPPGQDANPPRDIVKTPLYEAKVDPDIYFFGFDLTAEAARGGQDVNGEPDPGWFFVIKERPGEPRFGLDLPEGAPHAVVNTWNDLAWTDVLLDFDHSAFLRVGEKTVTLTDPGAASKAKPQYDEDVAYRWRGDTHAAELAYILYQLPVLVAVHAAEMLKQAAP